MRYLGALFLKFLMITLVLGVILWMFGMSFTNILLISLLVTAISFVSDMTILPRYGNTAATITDFAITFFIVLLGSAYLTGDVRYIGFAAFTPALVIALVEIFFHKFILKSFIDKEVPIDDPDFTDVELDHLQTEFGSEPDFEKPEERVDKKEKRYVPHRPRKRNKKNPY